MVQFLVFGADDLFMLINLVSKMRNCLVLYLERLLVLLDLLVELLIFLLQNQNLVIQILPLAVARLETRFCQCHFLA